MFGSEVTQALRPMRDISLTRASTEKIRHLVSQKHDNTNMERPTKSTKPARAVLLQHQAVTTLARMV